MDACQYIMITVMASDLSGIQIPGLHLNQINEKFTTQETGARLDIRERIDLREASDEVVEEDGGHQPGEIKPWTEPLSASKCSKARRNYVIFLSNIETEIAIKVVQKSPD